MARSRYIVGIDLGTTNCAVAYVDTKGRERPSADIRVFEVPQLVAPGETAPRPMLPSFLYLPGPHELPPGASQLPWNEGADRIVGEFARIQGARVPGHLVASAKSWLCHPGVDREADILPWGGPAGDAQGLARRGLGRLPAPHPRRLESHLRPRGPRAPARAAGGRPDRPRLVRRGGPRADPRRGQAGGARLDHPARGAAGRLLLLDRLAPGRLAARGPRRRADPRLRHRRRDDRLQPDHRGRDPDRARLPPRGRRRPPDARRRQHRPGPGPPRRAEAGGARLDAEQWSALRYACRTAKEKLLADKPAERWPVTIAGRGSKIIGGSLQSELIAGGGPGDRPRRLLPAVGPRCGAGAGVEARAPGVRPPLRGRPGDHQAPGRLPEEAQGRGDRAGGAHARTTGRPAPTPSSSTAGP